MLTKPKLDKISFSLDKRTISQQDLEKLIEFLDMKGYVSFHHSSAYLTVNVTPTKITREDVKYDERMQHNLQMNVDLLIGFFEDLKSFSISLSGLNVKTLHITKDRIMDREPLAYNNFLVKNQTMYKGRVRAFEVNNGTSPTVHICNYSSSLNRGVWLVKSYNKGEQLKGHLNVSEIIPLQELTKEDIKTLGRAYSKYTGRIRLDRVNLLRIELELKKDKLLLLPHSHKGLRVADLITIIQDGTLYNRLNDVFNEILTKALFPTMKEPLKASELDKFLISGNMSRFDSLFKAMGIYQNYKAYVTSIIKEEDLLLNEIRTKFMYT